MEKQPDEPVAIGGFVSGGLLGPGSVAGSSGRRGSNPRRQAWEACILPMNYSRDQVRHRYPAVTKEAARGRGECNHEANPFATSAAKEKSSGPLVTTASSNRNLR